MSHKYKVIFFGTSDFALPILEKLIKTDFLDLKLVITALDKPIGRKQISTPPPVKLLAQKYNIPILQPERIANCKLSAQGGSPVGGQIANCKPDLIVLTAYGQIIPKEILDIPKYGCLNLHPSLLPKYRGASPIQSAILNNEKQTGVTIMLMDEKMDHGPILAQREWEILNPKSDPRIDRGLNKFQIPNSKITYQELSQELAKLGANLLIETIPKWLKGEIKAQPQDHTKATYTKILKRENGKIDWTKSAEEIERQIRAFSPWPGSFTFWNNKSRTFSGYIPNKIQEGLLISKDINKKKNTFLKQTVLLKANPEKVRDKRIKIIRVEILDTRARPPVLLSGILSPRLRSAPSGLQNDTKLRPGQVFLTDLKELAVACGKGFLIIKELQLEGKKQTTGKAFVLGNKEIIGDCLK